MTITEDLGLDVQVTPLAGALGAEVRGLRLGAELTDTGFEAMRALLGEHLVLFFPDQHLSADEHRDLGRRFGEVEIHPFIPKLDDDHPEIVVLHSESGYVADVWHTDVTFSASPPVCSILQATLCPSRGGDTLWSNQQAAYAALAAPMQEMLNGLTAVHTAAVYGHSETQAEHPVVRKHPETGVPALFVNRQFTKRIVQLSREESDALLDFLYDFSEQPRFCVRYRWSAGSVGIWDNRCTQHHAVNDYGEPRTIQRVTVLGDLPEPAFDTTRWGPFAYERTSAAASGLDR
ncbi:MAG: TauD/TfdA family dioxygenase [Acidimicrobiales bacterium]|nr:TauD/TfdA family dioxygenase [Acidimicrobiales bacterium]